MEDIKVYLDEGASFPSKGYEDDAGIDICSPERMTLFPGETAIIDTGVHMQIPKNACGFVTSRSGKSFKEDIVTIPGVIDHGYKGSIHIKVINVGNKVRTINENERISQILLLSIIPCRLLWVGPEEFESSDRGENGFGSTGK